MNNDYRTHPVRLPLFAALMLRADEDERSILRLVAHEKPRRDDIRVHPRPSKAAQLLDFFEGIATCDVDLKGRAKARAEADKISSWIASHRIEEDHSDPHVQYKRAVSAIDAIFVRIVDDGNVTFSGILYDDGLPERRVILPEFVRDATVFWSGDDNACLRCSTATCIYFFQHVMVELADRKELHGQTGGKRKMPADVLDQRMQRMSELHKQGMDRTSAARQAIAEIPHRDHSLGAAVKCLMREFNERWPQSGDSVPR